MNAKTWSHVVALTLFNIASPEDQPGTQPIYIWGSPTLSSEDQLLNCFKSGRWDHYPEVWTGLAQRPQASGLGVRIGMISRIMIWVGVGVFDFLIQAWFLHVNLVFVCLMLGMPWNEERVKEFTTTRKILGMVNYYAKFKVCMLWFVRLPGRKRWHDLGKRL